MHVQQVATPGVGDNSYVVDHAGISLLIDPQRDVERFLDAAAGAVTLVLETHIHNDYISGGRIAAGRTGADLVMPAGSGAAYRFRPAFHQERIAAGGIEVMPIHTPGHTPEHVAYVLMVDNQTQAVFTGGSMLVGAAGRTDLLGRDRAEQLARLQYQSLLRLLELPDEVPVYPTHGAGSFCSATMAATSSSTIGHERMTSPVMQYPDEDSFVQGQLGGLQPYPTYYAFMGPINTAGPDPIVASDVPELEPEDVRSLGDGSHILDVRPRDSYAEGHIPGSWSVELREAFAAWVGWMIPFGEPLVLVLDDDQPVDEVMTELSRVGYDNVTGIIRGVDSWRASGGPVDSCSTMSAREFVALSADSDDVQVLDVRAPDEWADGHLEGSIHCYTPDLIDGIPSELDSDRPVYVGCTTGHRAGIAAPLLERAGYRPVVLTGASLLGVLMLRQAA